MLNKIYVFVSYMGYYNLKKYINYYKEVLRKLEKVV